MLRASAPPRRPVAGDTQRGKPPNGPKANGDPSELPPSQEAATRLQKDSDRTGKDPVPSFAKARNRNVEAAARQGLDDKDRFLTVRLAFRVYKSPGILTRVQFMFCFLLKKYIYIFK